MEGFQIRSATLEDKQAVLDINDNVYDGLDYLKDLYEDKFIKSSNTKSYVALYDNKIVGFVAATVVDDGQTVVSQAGRINQHYANKGVYKMLKNHASDNSGATIDAFTTGDTSPAINTSSFHRHNRLISKLTFMRFDMQSGDLVLQSSTQVDSVKLNLLTQELLQEYFKSDAYRKYLFPTDRIIVNWLPYRILPSNIPLIWKRNEYCERVTDLRLEDGNVRGLMSILTTVIGVSGVLVCSVDLFGTDIESVKAHLLTHFEYIRKRNTPNQTLLLVFDPDLGNERVLKICGEFGLKELKWNSFDSPGNLTALLLFEKGLSTDS